VLSRIAENVYWVGRYVERADDTVRLVATQYYGNLQVGSSHDRLLPDDLLAILGHPPPGEDLSSLRYAVARCVTAPDNQSSVASCLQAARENARRSREVLPLELWEILSAATRWLEDSGAGGSGGLKPSPPVGQGRADPDELLREVPQWTRAFYGLVDQAMPRTPAWTMLRLGMLLERADMTLRVLILATDTLAGRPERDPLTVHLWTTALKACAALDASYATTSGFPTRASVGQLLLSDRACPRSVLFCLETMGALAGGEPARRAAELAAALAPEAAGELLEGGSDGLQALLEGCGEVHEAIVATYLDLSEAS
jgi:uncharacterized alpha-E superfamily protein